MHAARQVSDRNRAQEACQCHPPAPLDEPQNPSKGGKIKKFIVHENQHRWSKTGFLIKFRQNGAREQPFLGRWRIPPLLRVSSTPVDPRFTTPTLFSSIPPYSAYSFSSRTLLLRCRIQTEARFCRTRRVLLCGGSGTLGSPRVTATAGGHRSGAPCARKAKSPHADAREKARGPLLQLPGARLLCS